MKKLLLATAALAISASSAMAFEKPNVDTTGLTNEEIQFIKDHNDYTYDIGTAGLALSLGTAWGWVDQNTNNIFDGSIVGIDSRDVENSVNLYIGDDVNGGKGYAIASKIAFDTDFNVDNDVRDGIYDKSLSGVQIGEHFPIVCYAIENRHDCKVSNYSVNVIVRDFPGLSISTADVVDMIDRALEDELGTAIRIKQLKPSESIYEGPVSATLYSANGWSMSNDGGSYTVTSPDGSQVYSGLSYGDIRNVEAFSIEGVEEVRIAPNGWVMLVLDNGRYTVSSPKMEQVYSDLSKSEINGFNKFK